MIQHNIRKLCRDKGLSLLDLAKEASVPYYTLRRWGTRVKSPSAISLSRVCKVLGTTSEELLKEEE